MMRDNHALRNSALIVVIQPLQFEARQFRLDPVGYRAIGYEAAAIDLDKIARELG